MLLLNLAGSAAAGFGAAVAATPAGTTADSHTLVAAAVGAAVLNAVGLFQKQPHANGQ
jgi:hypothetical protein